MSFLLRVFWERKKKKMVSACCLSIKAEHFRPGGQQTGWIRTNRGSWKERFRPFRIIIIKKNNQTADHLLCYSSKYSSRNTSFLFFKYNNWIHERERGGTLCYYYRGNKTGYRQNRRISNIRNMNGFIIFPFVYIYPHYYWALISLFRLLLDMSLVGGI